ncbi:MAG: ABC transporter permease [Acidobacteria bacterium]|nr:ABC transporter permease [Acidobacteriota bacterium]
MNDVAIALRQVRAEQRVFWSIPAAVGFGIAFPIMFLIIFGTIFSGSKACVDGYLGSSGQCVGGSTVPYNHFSVPTIAAWGMITTCFANLAIAMTIRRDSGQLKRLRGTPLPVGAFLAGVVGSTLITGVVAVALTIAIGALFYGAPLPATWLAVVITILFGGAVFCVLGMALTAIIPNPDAAPPLVNFSYLPLLFVSGFFYSFNIAWLNDVAKAFPFYWFKQALLSAYGIRPTASGWDGESLLVLLGWGIAGLLLALRFFRWQPRAG